MRFLVFVIVLIIIWFVPMIRHVHMVNCFAPQCPRVIYVETIKQYLSEEIQLLNYKMNFN